MSAPVSLRLEEIRAEILGHVYPLRVNMAVLERLQEGPGEGSIEKLMDLSTNQIVFEILLAMIQDACEDEPALPELTMKQLKKLFGPAQLKEMGVLRLFVRAVRPPQGEAVSGADTETREKPEPENSGN